MKVAVVGPGALGCLFAGRLAESGVRTVLVDHDPRRADRLARNGIVIEHAGEPRAVNVAVTARIPAGQDLIVVLTKSHCTGQLKLPPDGPVLTLQNGLGNVEMLCALAGSARVLAGATSEAATLISEGHTRHVAEGLTSIGAWTSCDPHAAALLLNSAGFNTRVTESPGQLLWEKLAICAGINPLTAILDLPNGRLLDLKDTRQLMRDLVVEAVKVAATEGYRFEHSIVETAESVCEATRENISSMLQDVRAGKRTEIEAISGEVLRRAQLASLPTPRTRVIYQIIKALEQR